MLGADALGRGVEVVVVEHHDPVGVVRQLLVDRLGEGGVGGQVAVLPGVLLLAAQVGRVAEVPEVVLDEPQHRVGDHVVVGVVGVVVDRHEAAPGVRAQPGSSKLPSPARRRPPRRPRRWRPRSRARASARSGPSARSRARPLALALEVAVRPAREGHGAAVRDQDQRRRSGHTSAPREPREDPEPVAQQAGVRKSWRTCCLPRRAMARASSRSSRNWMQRWAHSSAS